MSKFEAGPAQVPQELTPLIDDHFLEVQERWQDASYNGALGGNGRLPIEPEMIDVETFDGRSVLLGKMDPIAEPDGSSVALAFPYLQGMNETMVLRSAFMHQAVMPRSTLYLMPNIYKGEHQTVTLTDEEKAKVAEGSLQPVAEQYVAAFENLGLRSLDLTGYSKGARLVLEMAGISANYAVDRVNADEAPTAAGRTPKQLQKDFMASGTFGLQQKSMAESGFGSLIENYAGRTLMVDYAKFGIASLGKMAKLMHQGMTGSVAPSIDKILANDWYTRIKIGMVEGSLLTDPSDLSVAAEDQHRVRGVYYTGAAANKHTTGDNYAAHALMVKDGLGNRTY